MIRVQAPAVKGLAWLFSSCMALGALVVRPRHVAGPLKIGTLSAIVREIAAHLGMTRAELLRQLFS